MRRTAIALGLGLCTAAAGCATRVATTPAPARTARAAEPPAEPIVLQMWLFERDQEVGHPHLPALLGREVELATEESVSGPDGQVAQARYVIAARTVRAHADE